MGSSLPSGTTKSPFEPQIENIVQSTDVTDLLCVGTSNVTFDIAMWSVGGVVMWSAHDDGVGGWGRNEQRGIVGAGNRLISRHRLATVDHQFVSLCPSGLLRHAYTRRSSYKLTDALQWLWPKQSGRVGMGDRS